MQAIDPPNRGDAHGSDAYPQGYTDPYTGQRWSYGGPLWYLNNSKHPAYKYTWRITKDEIWAAVRRLVEIYYIKACVYYARVLD
jgi:hypothetical protein